MRGKLTDFSKFGCRDSLHWDGRGQKIYDTFIDAINLSFAVNLAYYCNFKVLSQAQKAKDYENNRKLNILKLEFWVSQLNVEVVFCKGKITTKDTVIVF